MRDQCKSSKGDAAHLQFLRDIHTTAKEKEVAVGSPGRLFQTKGGCPFAKDTNGKPILSPDYIVVCLFYDFPLKYDEKLMLNPFLVIVQGHLWAFTLQIKNDVRIKYIATSKVHNAVEAF